MGSRRLALELLESIDKDSSYANIALGNALKSSDLAEEDRAFVTNLVMTCVRMRLALDWLIDSFLANRRKHLQQRLRNVLRLGLCQVVYMGGVPDHAAGSETVTLAKQACGDWATGVTNAIMRRAIKEKDDLPWPRRRDDLPQFLSVFYSHPAWMVSMWLTELGPDDTEALLRADNEPRAQALRVNTLKIDVAGARQRLARDYPGILPSPYLPEAVRLEHARTLEPLLRDGLFYAQSEASMLAALALGVVPGDTVLDVCAAPGGKAAHLAAMMNNTGRLLCIDISETRARLISANLERCGVTCATVIVADATKVADLPMADRVLVDAPCSGLGTLYRKSDQRWRRTEADIGDLARLQRALLTNAWRFLKPGALLVYSVCTISKRETTDIYDWCLGTLPGVVPADIFPMPGLEAPAGSRGSFARLLPHIHDTDGMFIAGLRKKG